jgi:hypothetical protein
MERSKGYEALASTLRPSASSPGFASALDHRSCPEHHKEYFGLSLAYGGTGVERSFRKSHLRYGRCQAREVHRDHRSGMKQRETFVSILGLPSDVFCCALTVESL